MDALLEVLLSLGMHMLEMHMLSSAILGMSCTSSDTVYIVVAQVMTIDTLTADELSDVAWALGAAHHYTVRLPHLESGLQRLGPGMLRPLHITTVLWAFARLDYLPAGLLAAIGSSWQLAGPQRGKNGKRAAQAALPRMTARQLATCAWSLAALQQTGTPCFEALWVEICGRGLDGLGLGTTLRNDSLMQLHQAHLALQLEGGANTQQLAAATTSPSGAALLAKVRTTWEALSRPVHGQRESSQQRELANTLSSLGYFHVVVRFHLLSFLLAAAEAQLKTCASFTHLFSTHRRCAYRVTRHTCNAGGYEFRICGGSCSAAAAPCH